MSAARYIGRVGGLAVAFGVGTAVFTGHGVAAAEPASGGSESNTSSQGADDSGGSSGTTSERKRSDRDSAASDASDADAEADTADDADADDADADAADEPDLAEEPEADSTETGDSDLDAQHEPVSSGSGSGKRSRDNSETATQNVAETTATEQAEAWLSSPKATAGRAPAETTPVAQPTLTTTAVPPTTGDSTESTSQPTAPVNAVFQIVNGVLNPFAEDGPSVPPTGTPLEWAMAAAARRDQLVASGPISVSPTFEFTNGVIYGDVGATDSRDRPLIYTLIDDPDQGGKVTLNTDGTFSFLPDLSVVDSRGIEQFTVMVSQKTALVALLEQVPILGDFVEPIVLGLQQVPILGAILQPFIGYRVFAPIDVNVGALVPEGAPVAFTTMVTSFDGVQISTNFFPASGLGAGETATTVLNGPGLGSAGNIDPTSETIVFDLVPGLVPLRDAGYNVVTWDPRGEFASGGVLQLDNPFFEGRDVQAIIDWVATRPETELDAPGDPTMGMVGGSYGGGIQLVSAGIDDRIEAIVPVIAWNSLIEALYPTAAFKSGWGTLLGLDLLEAGARINSQIYPALILGDLLGFLTESQQAILASSGPTVLVSSITAPTLLIQGTADGLFTLAQSVTNALLLDEAGTPVSMIWACGGHGICLDPENPLQTPLLIDSTMAWLDKYVNGDELVPTGPRFEWFDQNGDYHSSDLLPTDPAFYGEPLVTTGSGGFLPLIPLLGGSGPQTQSPTPLLLSPAVASEAWLALDVEIPGPETTTEIVGAPVLSFSYSGLGTSRHIYAQLVNETTGLVLGNLVTPVPVTLDGRTHTVTVDLEQIAYTMSPGDTLTLQVVGSATPYENFTQWGFINVGDIEIALPTVAGATVEELAGAAEDLVAA
ncbi:S15 peptidase family protein [Mycolicibacterium hippocampi]|uniref:S15 peptidase family protein n=1 Tax=Mycolicibacterium hippocampi TaxID=659824 RepID=UPI0013D801B6|nr:CocE/NonD family hydrolase [Mycolicibacterium hippocampi]